ncbi:maleylpyruvate isomerase N-terminal domain-containing protein [Amycolatopsis palatopharyngis]|uniref:maleylpyruvate isomerase N-terminal domain-containing protein n=1 Tax=Amycolatopsis palatopharyngis TaxID=187982 RepID=UPI000E25265B|nr:maleylpyruvate isomerase N-terminal domain-containing protein [Amycolatopsis palatopharyngis]
MTGTRDDFLHTARSAADLLREPAVAAAWGEPSALREFSVGGLAGHLAYQILAVPRILDAPLPQERTVPLLEHYAHVRWIDAGVDDEVNVRIRDGGEQVATEGHSKLVLRVDSAIEELADKLTRQPDRAVRLPFWGPWSLMLDDLLITRMMELAVHSDDLAVSVGLETPVLPRNAVETVVDLLSRLASRRHGQTAVLRGLSRAERAPDTITAF